jgi:hypothetical protein
MARRPAILDFVADLPFQLPAPLATRLRAVADIEGKLPRALLALGLPADGDVGLLDDPEGWGVARLREHGAAARSLPLADPFRLDAPDGSLDAIVTLWSGFRGVDPAGLAEVDRVLRDGGRLMVVHDYGRDDVCALRPADAPEYTTWSRRDGPFLRGAGFRIHVVHCFWTFASVEDGRAFLGEAFGPGGKALADGIRRPRLAWNVAIYHRARGGAGRDGAP